MFNSTVCPRCHRAINDSGHECREIGRPLKRLRRTPPMVPARPPRVPALQPAGPVPNAPPKDFKEAERWYGLAAAQGYELAKTNLANLKKQLGQ